MHLERRGKLWNTAASGYPRVERAQGRQYETAMPTSPKPARKTAALAAAKLGGRASNPRLHPTMACDTAFRIIARRHLGNLTAQHEATCGDDPEALHQMRIALTHLRTAILFFSPMVTDSAQARIRSELKWLNAHLGIMRDIDVAIDRLRAINKRRPQTIPSYQAWTKKRADAHRRLARALRSARYRNLIKSTADWIEHGPWSIRKGKEAARNDDVVFRQLDEHTWVGSGHLMANESLYLVEGANRAVLIDAGTKIADLDKIVADLEARQRRPGCVLADRRVGASGVADDGTRADRG